MIVIFGVLEEEKEHLESAQKGKMDLRILRLPGDKRWKQENLPI